MRIRNYALLISFLVLSSRLFSQTLANYTTTRTTGITYNSISSTGNAIDSWRYAAGGFSQDDNRSNPMDIGFDFWYNGARYTQFNVSVNGYVDFSNSTADGGPDGGDYSYDNTYFTENGSGTWLALAPFYDDMTAQGGTDALGNSIKYKVSGTAPNRVLTIEWIDMAVYLNTSPSLNFQVKLYETTGEIDFVYGTMTQGTNTFSYTCGINAATLANTPTAAQLKTQQTANSNTFNNTQQNALVTLPASNSQITFVPPLTTPAPSGAVTFTGVTQTGMTVNWPNWCSNEVGYVVYGSTDNVTFNYITQTAANATSYASTGLLPGTLYYWKVYAVTEGALSTALSGSQTTTAAGTVISITTGNWNTTSTWNCGCIPSASDNVTIANTHTVTVNSNAICNTLTIGQGASGILRIGNNATSRSVTANSNIIVNAGATFDVATGSNTTHTLTFGGNLTNNGTLNFAPDANSFCDITFTKNGNQTISGTATTNNFHFLTLSMGTSINNTLDITSTNFSATSDFLTLNTGVFKLSTTGTVAITPFTALTTIPNTAGITVNSATATVTFGAGIDLFGNLIVNNGTVNIGNANNENVASDGGVFQIFGGTVKVAGCYYSTDINTLAKFTISGGTLTLPTSGSTSTTIAPFQIDGVGSTFNMSGGTIIIERKGGGTSNLGYTVTGVTNSAVTGGTLQIGDASTPAAQTIDINSSCRVGNLLVNSANATGFLTTNSLLVAQNITIASGTLNANNLNFTLGGNWTNNSTFTPGTGTVIFSNSTGQTIGGSVVTAYRGLTIDDGGGVTLALNTSVAGALTFVAGVINTGTNKVTITTTGSVTGAGSTKFVNGFLEKNVATGTNVTRNYEVGYGSVDYLPVSLTFASVTTTGNVTAKANDGDHPNIATSCIDPTQSVNRYWQFTNTGTVFTNYSATCNFIGVGSDADAGSVPANYYMSVYNGTTWTMLTQGTTSTTSNQGTGATVLGALQVGQKISPVITVQPLPTTVCNNTIATFSVTATGAVSYQWQQNTGSGFTNLANGGIYSGVTTTTLTINPATTAMNTYQYRCILNASCGGSTISNAVILTVTPNVAASVAIAASPSTTICAGTSVTFTATPANGGTTPAYQWKVNGVNVGTNSPTYITTTLTNGNTVTCVMTSNAACVIGSPATSNTLTITVNPNLPVSMSIAASPATTICAGTSVTFTATPTNGGTTPAYQWKVNGVNAGTNSPTFITTTLTNGNTVTCVLTSNATCATGNPATSNTITMTVNPNLPVSVSIAASPSTTVCAGTSVTFTATPTNGGTTPAYQWKVNGVNAGTNSSTFTTTTLTNGNTVTCVLTSNATCATGNPATSNTITMTVNPNLPVSVSIAASPATTICAGTSVTFTATPTNGGTTPAYQWKVNGVNAGTNSPTFITTTLTNGNTVTCVLTSNATCATGNPATSNTITMTVNPNLPASVSIAASSTTICPGTNVTFTATPANGGTTPAYQWKLNGGNVGTNSATYSNTGLVNGDVVTCVMTSNATPCLTGSPATSNAVTITVNAALPVSISIAASPSSTICAGTSVTFTATPVNGGGSPSYQWKVNGVNAGTNSPVFTTATLTNGNTVTCVLTSTATCGTGSPATSNTITMTVNPNLPVSVSIAASPSTTICAGTSVTFTATPTNGGTTPAYQWKVNGVNAGTNSATFTSTTLNNSDAVTCVLTSNASCTTGNPATSNTITMTVNPNLPVSVSIAASPSSTVCAGTSVTFTTTPTNGGTTPAYQWKVNGVNAGTNSPTFVTTTLTNGNTVTCVLTSNATCATGNPATSNTITMTVNPNLPVSVSIAASPATTICAGTSVTFTATPTNGGTTPAYQWKVNGVNAGTNSPTFTTTTLTNGNTVTCVLTSNATCATGSPATSNTITMTVNPNLPVSVSIAASPAGTICFGTNVTFTATPTNGGTTPAYQWKVNGVNVGTSSTTYSSATLNNTDVVTCVLTSNATCATGNPATSNAITMSVNPSLPVSVSIAAGPSATICAGSSVTFTATPTNGGTTPTYQWQVNGVNAGTNSTTFTSTTLNNSDAVTCIVTSNATCATGSPATANTITMTVNPNLPVSVSIAASPAGSVCFGTTVTYTATPVNGGTTPSYQWKVNGTNAGTNSATYSSSAFANGDVVTCVLTSNATCVTGSPATSNSVTQIITTPGNWIGAVSTDWSNAANWCGGVPLSTTDVTIPSGTPFAPVLTAAADCKNIDIALGVVVDLNNNALNVYGAFSGSGFIKGSLTSNLNINAGTGSAGTFNMDQSVPGLSNNLNSIIMNRSGATATVGNTITVTGTIGISAGTLSTGNNLTLVSTASGTARVAQLNAGADITGNVTMQRFIPAGTDGWIFLGSAISGATLQQWDDDFITGGFPGSQYPTSVINPSITGYDETLPGIYDDGYTVPTITDPINTGTGYWTFIMGTPLIVDVTGPIQKNQITFPVTYTDDPAQPASEDGWNLLANPYPSTIDWDGPGWTKTHMNNAVYMYSPTLDQYTSYVGGIGTNGGSNLIASSQAFLVQSNASGPVLKLQETGKNAADGLFIRASSSASADDLIKLDLTGTGTYKDETVIHFNAGATTDFDLPYDAMKFFSLTSTVPGIATMLDTNNMSVNTYPLLTSDLSIPVKVKVGTSGTYTINVDSITRMPEGACVILHDLLNGTQTDLRTTTTYSFYISDTTVYPRFVINIGAPVYVASTPSSCNGNANGSAVALGHGSGPWTYTWQNAAGAVVQTHTAVTGADTLDHIVAGTYTVFINGNSGACATMAGTVVVNGADSIDVQANIINAGCAGDPDGAINVTSVNGGNAPYNYSWSNGITGITNSNITAGTYSLLVTDSAGCIQEQTYVVPQNSALTAGFVMSTDTVLLNANVPVIYNNTSTGGTTFTWNFGDGSADNNAASPAYLYKLPGTYTVTLIVSDGTCTDTVTQTIIVLPYYSDPGTTTGISESAKANEQIKTATNGDESDLIFDFDKNTELVIEVYNSIGQQVFTKLNATVHKGKIALDFADKAKGIYYIKITSDTGINVVKKIVRS
ncbi:MAG: hypothetical protein JWP12_3 [Bacteroidetes bacterium]|nr:hypothetical protein [Bacteroidota bacterium]